MARRRVYTKEFKQEAVRLAKENGYTKTGRDLGINRSLIHKWRNQLEQHGQAAFPGQGKAHYDDEFDRLRRELSRVKEENAILKKAVGIFSKGPL